MFKNYTFLLLFIAAIAQSQNTVGTISLTQDAFDGYTLFTADTKAYLINNCGQVINEWQSNYPPGNAAYLLPNGNLLRAGKHDGENDINFGGTGGIVELFDWDGNLIWSYVFNDDLQRQHHDVYPMPNGNILVLLAEVWGKEEAISAGRDPNKLEEDLLLNEKIIEITPKGTDDFDLVWVWSVKDHIIQDFDSTKLNFGIVKDHPNKLNVNFLNGNNPLANWLHVNSIQYNSKLDQIIISTRNLSEFWVIDHSTTIQESTTSSGGKYGKGGDFLYRWGNPNSYNNSSIRKLYGQHAPVFVVKDGLFTNDVILFNNGNNRTPSFSEIFIIEDVVSDSGLYDYNVTDGFLPKNETFNYADLNNIPSDFYSSILSNAQKLDNGNILICEGTSGNFFEIDENEHIVWQYISPVRNGTGTIFNQNEIPVGNTSFRAHKYAKDYEAFIGRNVTPKNPIEGNFNFNACNSLSIDTFASLDKLLIYPNPSANIFKLNKIADNIAVYNNLGKKVLELNHENKINLTLFTSGIYFAKINYQGSLFVKKLIKN